MTNLVENAPVILEKIFIFFMYFHYFVIISPWKVAWHLIWTKLNPFYPRLLCVTFGWNRPSNSGEQIFFLISSMYLRCIVIISPWERTWLFIWRNLNPLYQRMLCAKFGLKLGQWFWKVNKWKIYRHTDRRTEGQTTENRRQKRLLWALSSDELKKNHYLFLENWRFLLVFKCCAQPS